MSVAFVKEESAEAASETILAERPISQHANLVTESGLQQLQALLQEAQLACDAASKIEDVNERRRQSALPARDARYYAARLRSAQVVGGPNDNAVVAFGSKVKFRRADGRVQSFRIVGEDEANPAAGTISHTSPVATLLIGKSVGDVVGAGRQELKIIEIKA